jgi:hypothetical protein
MAPPKEKFTTPEYNVSEDNYNNYNSTNKTSSNEKYDNISQKTTSDTKSELNDSSLLVNDSESVGFNSSFSIHSSSNLTHKGLQDLSNTNVSSSSSHDKTFNVSIIESTTFPNSTESISPRGSNVMNLTTNSSSISLSNANVTSLERNPQIKTIDLTSNSSSQKNSSLNGTIEFHINQTSQINLLTTSTPIHNGTFLTTNTTTATTNTTTATVITNTTISTTINTTSTTINTTITTATVSANTTTTTPLINFEELGTYNTTIPEKTYIIVAYRNREENKKVFMPEMNKYLSKKVIWN